MKRNALLIPFIIFLIIAAARAGEAGGDHSQTMAGA